MEFFTSENLVLAKWKYKNGNEYKLGNIKIGNYYLYVNPEANVFLKTEEGFKAVNTIINSAGYICVRVKPKDETKFKDWGLFPLHQIIAYTFIGLPPEDMVESSVEHINQRKLDCSLDNLCYMEKRENRSNRIFGSKATRTAESIRNKENGNRDYLYDVRNTNKIKKARRDVAANLDYDSYLAENESFLDIYR